MSQTIQLIDPARAVVAIAEVTHDDGLFSGSVDLQAMPSPMRMKFEEYENIVHSQMLSLLDRIEDEIAQLGLKAVFGQGIEESLTDLQVYPRSKVLSFRLKSAPLTTSRPASNGAAISR